MSTYAIGDIHGCYNTLQTLLDKISFNPLFDSLRLTGDLVNRGPHSLKTLRFIKSLGSSVISVLGNHDILLLALANQKFKSLPSLHPLSAVLEAPDCEELLEWLRHQPLLHYDEKSKWLLVHAGLCPSWNLSTAITFAKEAEQFLLSSDCSLFYHQLSDLKITKWDPFLKGLPRFQFIIHCLTRIRFCTIDGNLDFNAKGSLSQVSADLHPWFRLFSQNNPSVNILFGHWAALQGQTNLNNIIGLDTGCVWGRQLTALRLEDLKYFSVNAKD